MEILFQLYSTDYMHHHYDGPFRFFWCRHTILKENMVKKLYAKNMTYKNKFCAIMSWTIMFPIFKKNTIENRV